MAENKSPNLYQRLLAITSEIGKIEKTGRNSQQGYAFIEQAKIVAELRPQLVKNGVFIIPEVMERQLNSVTNSKGTTFTQAIVSMRFKVINAEDPTDSITVEWVAGEALDTSDKATNKAITAAQKTFLMKLFNISDQDDPDQHSPEAPTAPVVRPAAVSANSVPNEKVAHARELMTKLGKTGKEGLEFTEMAIGKKIPVTEKDFDGLIESLEAFDTMVGGE